jgi:hypothetical protein
LKVKLLFLVLVFVIACSKDPICGVVTGGGFDRWTGQPYLMIDDNKEYVDLKTYESFFINDLVCLE